MHFPGQLKSMVIPALLAVIFCIPAFVKLSAIFWSVSVIHTVYKNIQILSI